MIEERGRVVSIETACVWVETQRQSACGKCQAGTTCGHGLMNRLLPSPSHNYVPASCDFPVSVNDEVTIALPEQALLSASFLVYLMPLLTLFAGLIIGVLAQLPEPLIIVLSLAGLASGFFGVRWWTHSCARGLYKPVVRCRHVPRVVEPAAVKNDTAVFSTLND